MYTAHVRFFTNLDLFCIDNARVIYRKIRYFIYIVMLIPDVPLVDSYKTISYAG